MQQGVQAGAAADVFAAALLVFYALTGRSYWRSCQGAAPDLAMWQQELVGPRDAASTRAGQIGVQLDRAFDPVLGCALGMDPNQRYRSIGELAAAMEGRREQGRPNEARTVAFPQQSEYPPPPPPLGAPGTAPAGYAAPVQAADPARQPLGGPTLASARRAASRRRPNRLPDPPRRRRLAPIVVGLAAAGPGRRGGVRRR